MSAPFEAQMAIFLRAIRHELVEPGLPDDAFRSVRAQRLAAAIDFLIMRAEEGRAIDDEASRSARDLLRAHGGAVLTEDPDGAAALAGAARARARRARNAGDRSVDHDDFVRALRDEAERRAARMAEALSGAARSREELFGAQRQETPPLTAEAVTAFLKARFPANPDIAATNFVRPAGVYSKENYSFDLVGLDADPIPAILRRDRGFEIIPTSASGEFELLNALRAQGQPVARCIAAQTGSEPPLDGPCLIMKRVAGSPPGMARATPDDKRAWADMVLQLAPALAGLHAVDVHRLPLAKNPESNREAFLAVLDDYHDRLQRCQREPHPLVEAAFVWLYNHASLIDDRRTLVHGDYDMRNVLFDKGRLTAVLDFELAHIGHPAEDLGYVAPDVLEALDYAEFLTAYRAAGGADIAMELVHYFHVWRWTFHAVCNIVAFSGYHVGIHDDLFLGTVSFIEFRRVQEKLMALLPGGALHPA
ncbi:hypothetical protein MB02_11225 [Croceicoccus estronivorus]|uniref:phosphotransferase family protein n=1 Tax=Croceicoccus estronivorus TaxID=1172626 RepID=UPI00082D84FE|nr:phosphotransferase family protein [Croceicoccus estronivorus]OCC23720.1 hypothetical protein MB02_11225 [Croceicoccus estronivorus]